MLTKEIDMNEIALKIKSQIEDETDEEKIEALNKDLFETEKEIERAKERRKEWLNRRVRFRGISKKKKKEVAKKTKKEKKKPLVFKDFNFSQIVNDLEHDKKMLEWGIKNNLTDDKDVLGDVENTIKEIRKMLDMAHDCNQSFESYFNSVAEIVIIKPWEEMTLEEIIGTFKGRGYKPGWVYYNTKKRKDLPYEYKEMHDTLEKYYRKR